MAQRLHFLLSALALFGVACSDGAGEETSGQTSDLPDPCAGVICDNPPTATCPDPASLRTWASPGVCTDGECSYTPAVEHCPFGCEIDACLPDPCLTVVCSDPPAPECDDADTLRTYAANGTCVASECEYPSSTSLCEHGCDAGACAPDPCLAIVCDDFPVVDTCVSGAEAQIYDSLGTCADAECTYTPRTVTCSQGCVDGVCFPLGCADLEWAPTATQVAIVEGDGGCLEDFVGRLEADPTRYLDAFFLLVESSAASDDLFLLIYDEVREDRFRFEASVVDALFDGLPGAVAACGGTTRCNDWEEYILRWLYEGSMFLCPNTATAPVGELLAAIPYGDFDCTASLAVALGDAASDAIVTELLDVAASHFNGWSRRNAIRILGTIAGRGVLDAGGQLVQVQRAADVKATLLERLEVDTDDNVLQDAIWVLDSYFYPFAQMQGALEALSLNSGRSSAVRFRAAAAITRLLQAQWGVLPQADFDYLLAALQTDDSWVRAQAAYTCERLTLINLGLTGKNQLVAGLEAAYAVETVLHAKVYMARALDKFDGGTSRFDQLQQQYEAGHLAEEATGAGILIRSGLPANELPAVVTLMENERAAYFDILGSPFDTPVAGDTNDSIVLILFATRDEYREYMDAFVGYGAQAGGLYLEGDATLYTYQRTPAQSIYTVEELIQHEFGHYLQGRHVFVGQWSDAGYHNEPKAWADEGMAETLGGLSFDGGGGYTLNPRTEHLDVLCGQPYRALSSLLEQREGYDEYGTFDYSNGWAFLYYLVSERISSVRALFGSFRSDSYDLGSFATIAGVGSVASLEADWHATLDGWCNAAAGPVDPKAKSALSSMALERQPRPDDAQRRAVRLVSAPDHAPSPEPPGPHP